MRLALPAIIVVAAIAAIAYFKFFATGTSASPHADQTARTPEEELAGFTVADGFVIELVASEKDGIVNPVDLTFDDAGRLWTQTASMYPLDPFADIKWNDLLALMNDAETQRNHPSFKKMLDLYQGRSKGVDKILVLSDLYSGKKTATVSVWADNLTIPMSVLPYKQGAYVAQGSEIFFLDDTDGDGKADKRVPLFTGFGFTDTHTMSHVLVRGPGDWIHFSHGALNKGEVSSLVSDARLAIDYSKIARFSLDGAKIELVNAGLNNIWGFQLRHNGQWYATEANDLGYSVVPMEPGSAYPGIGNEKIRSYQPFVPKLYDFRVGGTGLSGLAFDDDLSGSFPEEWKDVAFLANPITSKINAVKAVRNADGTVTATHLPDFLTSDDKFFRPVNMEFGPDGCLYIADWYDKIISHNEVPTTHPDRDKAMGRIWRIRHVGQKPREIPDFYTVPTADLVKYLQSPSLWEKRSAWHQITDRPAEETRPLIPALVALVKDGSQQEQSRIHALWSLEGLQHYDAGLMEQLLKDKSDNLRRESVRSLASFALSSKQVADALQHLVEDANPQVRSQVLRTLDELGQADAQTIGLLVQASKPSLPGENAMGGVYERNYERYLALKALERYPQELYTAIRSGSLAAYPPTHLLWAIQALPKPQKEEMFFAIWPKAGIRELDEPTFVWLSRMLSNQRVYQMVKPLFDNKANGAKYVQMALDNEQQVKSRELAALLQDPVSNLLRSGENTDKQLALKAIRSLEVKTAVDPVLALAGQQQTDEETLRLVLAVLDTRGSIGKPAILQIAGNTALPFDLRVNALNSLAKIDAAQAGKTLGGWIGGLNDDQKKTLTNILSGSEKGVALLTGQYQDKQLVNRDFTLSSAEKVYAADSNNVVGRQVLADVRKRIEEEKAAFESKLSHYLTIANKKGGKAQNGKKLFNTCLMCHKVGNEGQDIAPALDGSASREADALLTALLDPDAAVERGYNLYRVTKTDNSSLEGYRYHGDDNGTTLAFMGGQQVFIESKAIKSQGFLGGRSFMPGGLLDNLSDDEVADLLAYIRTLK